MTATLMEILLEGYPEEFAGRSWYGQGNGTCLVFRDGRRQYLLAPLGGARFVRALWSAWRPPWAGRNAKPPRFGLRNTMSPSLRTAMARPRGQFAGEAGDPRPEDARAVRELYRCMGWGRFQPKADLGAEATLDAATMKRLEGLVLHGLNAAHGQGLDEAFGWPRGMVAAEVEYLYTPGNNWLLHDPSDPRGVVFSLCRHTPGSRPDRFAVGAVRAVLHNDGELVLNRAAQLSMAAKVMAVVTVPGRGEFYLQRTKTFYEQVRRLRPWLANPDGLTDKEQWRTRGMYRRNRNLFARLRVSV